MTAVHIQLREDAELGAAWRRANSVQGYALAEVNYYGPTWHVTAFPLRPDGSWMMARPVSAEALTPTDALNALADALEARAAE